MASVAEIDGLTVPTGVPPAFTGLLDTYTGAAAAYSVRQLKSGITVAMRVRRETAAAGDNDEADVAFDTSFTNPTISLDSAISNASAGVTATTLGQFLNVGTVNGTTYTNPDSLTVTASCLTDTWYDQSGNANHAEQTTYAVQPKIHDGTVDTDLILDNGKPALEGSGDLLEFTAFNLTDDFAISHVGQYQTQDSIYGGSSGNFAGYGLTTTLRWRYSGSNVNFAFTYST